MKKVKVMHVLGSRNLWGAEKIASEICNGMPRSEFEMVYVSPDGPIRKVLEGMGVNYVPIDRMTPRSIGAAMKQFNPDIIHAHDNKASLLSYLSSVFRRNRPYIISHIHNSYPYLRRFGLRRMIDSVFRPRYSINIFCSEPISKYYEQYAPYFYKLHGRMVMENFTDAETNRAKAGSGVMPLADGKPRVGFVGRLEYQKGLDAFFAALADYRKRKNLDADIHIVGTGSMKDYLVGMTEGLGVRFEGYCENPFEWMQSFNLLILPSRYEGLPLTILEAMSLGTPVLAMSTGSIGEIIEDGKNGWIVKNGDYEGFIRKLDYIVSNRKILDEVSREASRSMEERFGKRNYIEGIKEMYKELYNRKGIPT